MKYFISIGWLMLMGFAQPSDKNYLLGRFDPEQDSRFERLRPEHSSGSAMGGVLRREAYEAFVRMETAARKDGVSLIIISATRNFQTQKAIWENKWNGKVMVEGKNLATIPEPVDRARIILHYSSMPGSSRHHWGTDMDLNSLDNSYFESGEGLITYRWLLAHAAEFGFCQPYTSKAAGRTGYEEEKWHWSYLPLSGPLLKNYREQIRYEDITGFDGSAVASKLNIIEEYVAGVGCENRP